MKDKFMSDEGFDDFRRGQDFDAFHHELDRLWREVVEFVYLKNVEADTLELAERAWWHTKFSPLRYVLWVADPRNLTNRIVYGQKARERRWKEWVSRYSS